MSAVRSVEPESVEHALDELQSLVQEQRTRLTNFRDSAFLRRFSETTTRQRSSLVAGMMNSALRTERRWNQELQDVLERPGITPAERREAANAILDDFAAAARRITKEFILRWHFGESPQALEHHESTRAAPRAQSATRSRASSRADSTRDLSRRNSPTPDIDGVIAQRRRSATSVGSPTGDDGPWATVQDEAAGLALRLSLCETPVVAKRAAKEAALQLRLLGLLIDMAPDGRLPVTVHPTCVCTFAGHSVRVTAPPTRCGSSLDPETCPELALALEYAGEALNIARYDCADDSGKTVEKVGPPTASAFEGGDGRLYLDTVLGFFPHFPPARGSPITSAHTLFLRPEAVAAYGKPVSPGAFVTFGGTIGPKLREQTAQCAQRVCSETIPRLAKELVTNPPPSAEALVAERMKPMGVNVALLAILLSHVPVACEPVRRLIFTEMVARAARWRLEERSADESDGVADAFKAMCAQLCDADEQGAAFEELLPTVHAKFPGAASLVAKQLRLPSPLFDGKAFTQRLADLHGMVLARGVSGSSSVFHITVERMKARASSVAIGPGIAAIAGPSRRRPSFGHRSPSPDHLSPDTSKASLSAPHDALPPHTPPGTVVPLSLEMQQQRAALLARALQCATPAEGAEACRSLGEMAHHRSLRTNKTSFAYRYELFAAGCHVAHVAPEKAIHFLSQALEGGSSTERSSHTMVRALCERARLLIDAKRYDDAERDLDDVTPRLRIGGADSAAFGKVSYASSPASAGGFNSDKFSAFDEGPGSGGVSPAGSLGGKAGGQPAAATANATATIMFQQLARLHQARGNLAAAEEALKSVLSISIALHGEYHLATAAAFGILGYNLFQQGPPREAEAIDALDADIRICHAVDGDRSVHMAASAGNLAVLFTRAGRHAEAVELHRLDADITAADPTASPLDVATAKSGLGVALSNVGLLREAQAAIEDALRLRIEHVGPQDMSVASALSNLGKTLILRFKDEGAPALLAAAEANCLNAIAVTEALQGPAHKFLRVPLEHLAGLYAMRGDGVARDVTAQRLADVGRSNEAVVPFRQALAEAGHTFAEVTDEDADVISADPPAHILAGGP